MKAALSHYEKTPFENSSEVCGNSKKRLAKRNKLKVQSVKSYKQCRQHFFYDSIIHFQLLHIPVAFPFNNLCVCTVKTHEQIAFIKIIERTTPNAPICLPKRRDNGI